MTPCLYTRARTIEEAIDSLVKAEGDAHIIAGGVASGIMMNEKLLQPEHLLDISCIDALKKIERTPEGGVIIGALMTHWEVLTSPIVAETIPLMIEMCHEIACGRVQSRGTIGGNLCLADPQGDPPVALLALKAILRAAGPNGQRDIPIADFFEDVYTTALGGDEILQEIIIPPTPGYSGAAYGKYGARKAMDYATTISVAVQLVRDPGSGLIKEIGVGMGGVGIIPVRPQATEAVLLGTKPGEEVFSAMRDALFDELEPLGDALYSADYKCHVAWVLLKRALEKAYERAAV